MKKLMVGMLILVSLSLLANEHIIEKDDRVHFTYATSIDHHVGTVIEVFGEQVKIKSDTQEDFIYMDIDELGKGSACIKSLCQTHRVHFTYPMKIYDHVGSIVEIFDDGEAKVKSDTQEEFIYMDIYELSKAL